MGSSFSPEPPYTTGRIAFDGYLLGQETLSFFNEADRADEPENYDLHAEFVSVYKTVGGKLILTVADEFGQAVDYSIHTSFLQLSQDPILSGAVKPDLARFLDAVSGKIGEDWAITIE